jgi:LysM repeat protein
MRTPELERAAAVSKEWRPAAKRSSPVLGARSPATARDAMLALQRMAGNPAVGRVLRARILARYEAGEHAQLGKTGDDLRALVSEQTFSYKVKRGETLSGIAAKFGITVAQLEITNQSHLRRWRRIGGVGTMVGFNEGDKVKIPPVLTPPSRRL